MKKYIYTLVAILVSSLLPLNTAFAAGLSASGGGTFTVGQTFKITVRASGAEFDSLQGNISVSGPVSIVSFAAGSGTWLPGKAPANGQAFAGIVSKTSSMTVATITLKGTKEGSGSVSVSGAKLARNGAAVGGDASGAKFTISRALTPPGGVKVSSSTHPDENTAYPATTIALSWEKPSGVTEFSYLLDQAADTTPPATKTSSDTSVSYADKAIGTYYFHLRAKNGDGWGPATHFKITIKEPDPQINEALSKPTITAVEKSANFQTNIDEGTVTGITLKGKVEPTYKVNFNFTPVLADIPAETLTATPNETGEWSLIIDKPIRAGFYKLAVQGQLDKSLTPVSDPVRIELSVADGGKVSFITSKDAIQSPAPGVTVKASQSSKYTVLWALLFALAVVGLIGFVIRMRRR